MILGDEQRCCLETFLQGIGKGLDSRLFSSLQRKIRLSLDIEEKNDNNRIFFHRDTVAIIKSLSKRQCVW